MCLFSFGLYFWVLIPNLYLVQNKCCFSVFVCLRHIFLYFVHPLMLIFAWVCYSCFGVLNQLKSSIRLVCLRPIFLYLFKNLFWNKCCFSVFAYHWPKFPSVVLKCWAFGVYSHTLFSNMVLNNFFLVCQIYWSSLLFWCAFGLYSYNGFL